MASTRIYRTAGTPTNTKKFTLSFWLKKSVQGADQFVFNTTTDANNRSQVEFNTDDQMNFICTVGGSQIARLRTTRVFRDPSAWYHIVAVLDTTDSTSTDRMKIYINGERNLSADNGFASETYPSADADVNVSGTHTVGSYYNGSSASNYLDGVLTHVHFIDGTAYQASTFGETDSTSGIWVPKTSPSVTYGTNGFFLKFENSGNLDLDSSSNGHTFTTAGTLTQNVDTPSSNFPTWNPLYRSFSSGYASAPQNGNLYVNSATSDYSFSVASTLAFPGTGKFYWEYKIAAVGTVSAVGISEADQFSSNNNASSANNFGNQNQGYAYKSNGDKLNNNSTASYGNTYTTNDIIQVAYNNGAIWFGKNGTWQNNATDSEIAAGTTTYAAYTGITTSDLYHIAWNGYNTSGVYLNAGQGYFGTTQVSSAQNPSTGDTSAIFEYTPPTGLQPVTTKGINE